MAPIIMMTVHLPCSFLYVQGQEPSLSQKQKNNFPALYCVVLEMFSMSFAIAPYNLVFLFNVGPEFFLCNVGEICAMLGQYLQQAVIIKKLIGPK